MKLKERKVKSKAYYRIQFELMSPLSVSSGDNVLTDHDIITDCSGMPYIPASAIAGVCRDWLKKAGEPDSDIKKYLGFILKNTGNLTETEAKDSRILFYDACIKKEINGKEQDYHVTVRDSVKLDSCKTAIKGAKFDMEILEPGVIFETYLEQDIYFGDVNYADKVAYALKKAGILFGGKTTRGYGKIGNVFIWKRDFDFGKESEVRDWLKFNLYAQNSLSDDKFKYQPEERLDQETAELRIKLEQKGGISIRKYTTRVSQDKKYPEPDYEQLTVNNTNGSEGIPVIPGTTWAGAIRHRMYEIAMDLWGDRTKANVMIDGLFGYVDTKKKAASRSFIRFSETQLDGAKSKKLSRNAINRFSGGTAEGALFTERTWYGGRTELVISLSNGRRLSDEEVKLLSITISDLHQGFLAVGGLTAVGRGLFSISEINGIRLLPNEANNGKGLFQQIQEQVKTSLGGN